MMQVMVIAADQNEKEIITFVLRRAGLAVASSSDHQRVLKNWTEHPADLMVVASLEDQALIRIAEEVRAVTQIPLLMIVDRIGEKDRCDLLQNGADVILDRPVSAQVLSAQIQALLRRSAAVPSFVLPTLALNEITLDPSARTVSVSGKETRRLTQLEFRLLYTLMTNRGQVVPLDVLVERVWGYTGGGNRDLVRGLVSRLRRKIEPDPEQAYFLETIPGVGYRFTVEEI
ncbi:MAG TPA: response regulator transcription factor [Anaerolineae bacterium]|nr:response regulator transcription factor [Anaerolineae bacterium]